MSAVTRYHESHQPGPLPAVVLRALPSVTTHPSRQSSRVPRVRLRHGLSRSRPSRPPGCGPCHVDVSVASLCDPVEKLRLLLFVISIPLLYRSVGGPAD